MAEVGKILPAVAVLVLLCTGDLFCKGMPSEEIMLYLRLPRMLTALIAAGGLSVAGAQMQSIFRNPLADPYIMGVSSGAALGAATVTLLGLNSGISLSLAAICGAGISAAIILVVSAKIREANTLLTFGILLAFFTSAMITILQYTAEATQLKSYYLWSAGSFSSADYMAIAIMSTALAAGLWLGISNAKALDLILFGDEYTVYAGASPRKIRIKAIMSACLIAGSVTAFCGPIGFVGIVVPQLVRKIFRSSSHRRVLPLCLLLGASFGLFADICSQLWMLPVSATMAFVGIPIIIDILLKPGK